MRRTSRTGNTGRHPRRAVRSPRDRRGGSPRRYCAAEAVRTRPFGSSSRHTPLNSFSNLNLQGRPLDLIAAWQSPDHDIRASAQRIQQLVADGLHSAAHDITPNGSTDAFRDDEAESGWCICIALSEVDHRMSCSYASSTAHGGAVVRCRDDAVLFSEHRRCLARG